MTRRVSVAAALLVAAAVPVTLAAQRVERDRAAGASNPKVVVFHAPASYKVPRTPWGDPDLQGNFTNLSEAGTPMERPAEYVGRNMNDISPEERARIKKKLAEDTIGRFLGPTEAPDNWWQPAYGSFVEHGAQLWLVVDPPDGRIPPLTPEAQKRHAAAAATAKQRAYTRDHPAWVTDLTLYDRCITRGYPGSMLPAIYGNAYQIVQAPGYVAITMEMVHETRVIPLDGSPHPARDVHLDMGDARGHWEGDTLVVETTNFRDRSAYQDANADTLKLTERFTRLSPRAVGWQVTVEDPSTWTRPWSFAMPLTEDESQPAMPYECHEGNYGVPNILSATRAEERQQAAHK